MVGEKRKKNGPRRGCDTLLVRHCTISSFFLETKHNPCLSFQTKYQKHLEGKEREVEKEKAMIIH